MLPHVDSRVRMGHEVPKAGGARKPLGERSIDHAGAREPRRHARKMALHSRSAFSEYFPIEGRHAPSRSSRASSSARTTGAMSSQKAMARS